MPSMMSAAKRSRQKKNLTIHFVPSHDLFARLEKRQKFYGSTNFSVMHFSLYLRQISANFLFFAVRNSDHRAIEINFLEVTLEIFRLIKICSDGKKLHLHLKSPTIDQFYPADWTRKVSKGAVDGLLRNTYEMVRIRTQNLPWIISDPN